MKARFVGSVPDPVPLPSHYNIGMKYGMVRFGLPNVNMVPDNVPAQYAQYGIILINTTNLVPRE